MNPETKPELTADALVRLVHRYYPAGLLIDDLAYKVSKEIQRLRELQDTHVQPSATWTAFITRLRQEFSDCSLWDTTVPYLDPCYSIRVSLPGFQVGDPLYDCVVCLLSQFVPVYALYASHTDKNDPSEEGYWLRFPPFPPKFQSHEARLAALIESTFGFTRLSNDVLHTPVLDLVPKSSNFVLGEAKLIDCLFTPHRW
ncbi:MAG TPA: hypothetical protein VFZ09_51095 [Archangium sp.]|uniref:hypothetical protein n=1 Tax=Archangium sp. TaxID=1872627 RepID=UPI002E303787|nr:hypothetical protein [Archangium sp.]HEX5754635.1 hypothetical protein [Archangium sp.]